MQPLDVVKTRMQIQTRPVIATGTGTATATATAATAEVSYSACNFNQHRDQLVAAFKRAELREAVRERETERRAEREGEEERQRELAQSRSFEVVRLEWFANNLHQPTLLPHGPMDYQTNPLPLSLYPSLSLTVSGVMSCQGQFRISIEIVSVRSSCVLRVTHIQYKQKTSSQRKNSQLIQCRLATVSAISNVAAAPCRLVLSMGSTTKIKHMYTLCLSADLQFQPP